MEEKKIGFKRRVNPSKVLTTIYGEPLISESDSKVLTFAKAIAIAFMMVKCEPESKYRTYSLAKKMAIADKEEHSYMEISEEEYNMIDGIMKTYTDQELYGPIKDILEEAKMSEEVPMTYDSTTQTAVPAKKEDAKETVRVVRNEKPAAMPEYKGDGEGFTRYNDNQ